MRFLARDPLRLRITGRTRHYVNAFGENVIVEEIERALTSACRRTEAEVVEFTVAPRYPSVEEPRGGHEWLVEFRVPPREPEEFVRILDGTLAALNTDYRTKRWRDVGMVAPRVLAPLPPGTFQRWMRGEGRGAAPGAARDQRPRPRRRARRRRARPRRSRAARRGPDRAVRRARPPRARRHESFTLPKQSRNSGSVPVRLVMRDAISPVVKLDGVGKRFGETRALHDVSVTIAPGRVRRGHRPVGRGKDDAAPLPLARHARHERRHPLRQRRIWPSCAARRCAPTARASA